MTVARKPTKTFGARRVKMEGEVVYLVNEGEGASLAYTEDAFEQQFIRIRQTRKSKEAQK